VGVFILSLKQTNNNKKKKNKIYNAHIVEHESAVWTVTGMEWQRMRMAQMLVFGEIL